MQREVILVTGKTGSGKTYWARQFVLTKSRVLILDAGFCEFPADHCETFDDLLQAVKTKSFFRLSYSPRWWEYPACFQMARAVGEMGGPIWVVLEEADRIDDPRSLPEYDDIINRGRHWGLNLLALTTRPYKLPPDYRAQATRVVAFSQHEPNDIKYLSDIIGEEAYKIPNLSKERHEYLEISLDKI